MKSRIALSSFIALKQSTLARTHARKPTAAHASPGNERMVNQPRHLNQPKENAHASGGVEERRENQKKGKHKCCCVLEVVSSCVNPSTRRPLSLTTYEHNADWRPGTI